MSPINESSSDNNELVTPKYLMSPELFHGLSNVSGFNNLNGHTYQEHVTMALSICGELKQKILVEEDYDNLMNLLKDNGYNITHSMETS